MKMPRPRATTLKTDEDAIRAANKRVNFIKALYPRNEAFWQGANRIILLLGVVEYWGYRLPTFHNCLVYLEFQGFSIEVICTIDGFETNKKPGNQFQNKSLKAIQAILEYIWSSLFNASSPIKVYPWKKIIDQKITPTLLRKSKHFFCWWPSIISFKMWTSNLDTVRLVFWVISTPNEMTPLTHYTQVPDL